MKRSFLFTAGSIVLACLLLPSLARPATNLVLTKRIVVWQPGISPQLVAQLNQPGPIKKPVPAFLNFVNSLSLQNHQLLQASGVKLEEYYGDTFYSALLPPQTFLTNTNVLTLIFSAEPVLPTDKVLVPAAPAQLPDWSYDPVNNTVRILVAFWEAISTSTVTQDLASVQLSGNRYGVGNLWAVVAPLPALTNLAALFSVKTIEVGPTPPLPLNERGRPVANTDAAQGIPAYAPPTYKMSGRLVRIAICDDGIVESRPDFQPSSRFFFPDTATTPLTRHGTQVASIAAGTGAGSSAAWYPAYALRGHAPDALIGDFYFLPDRHAALHAKAVLKGADVCNHSYVQSFTLYDAIAADLDKVIRGGAIDSVTGLPIPARPSVWAAGNNGYEVEGIDYEESKGKGEEGFFSVFASAKNGIAVGSVDTESGVVLPQDDPNTKTRSFMSSMGPTFDGRIKPDVVAPGNRNFITLDSIVASDAYTTGYYPIRGTSAAAPVVSGIIAIMMEQYRTACPSGPALHPAMYKAILIHTAHDLEKLTADPGELARAPNPDTSKPSPGDPTIKIPEPTLYPKGPDFATGYGLVDAEAARQKIAATAHWTDDGLIAGAGMSEDWCITVPLNAKELKVVIAWDDEPGCTSLCDQRTPRLVNDLDLELTDPDGHTVHPNGQPYLPWVPTVLKVSTPIGDGNPDPISTADTLLAATRCPDHTNNVEMVTIDPLTPGGTIKDGRWRATVKGFKLAMGHSQRYSLVSSHAVSQCPTEIAMKNICRLFPIICEPHSTRVPGLEIVKSRIRFPTFRPVSIDEICKYVINCPGCEGGEPWLPCSGFELDFRGVPGHAQIVLFDGHGTILQQNATRAATRTVEVPPRLPGEQRYVAVVARSDKALAGNLDLNFKVRQTRQAKGPR